VKIYLVGIPSDQHGDYQERLEIFTSKVAAIAFLDLLKEEVDEGNEDYELYESIDYVEVDLSLVHVGRLTLEYEVPNWTLTKDGDSDNSQAF